MPAKAVSRREDFGALSPKDTVVGGAEVVKSDVIERKVGHDGRVREYRCAWEYRSSRLAIIRYDIARGGVLADGVVTIPAGSRSYGYFWKGRRYGCYRFIGPENSGVVAHRFDALTRAAWTEDVLEYHDLLLDWWVTDDDVLLEEDRDEFEAAMESGEIGADDAKRALGAARDISSRYRHIIDDIAVLERRHVKLDS